ncbi:hypothetical protein ZEAMMB73_Zm00001d015805 [Zea mays]|uniref:Uncharacterized protein n=1 Tax=Zea mays TaxID=4577 RepID=A0A1D6H419_MAIZE|nr:hypothetical protein ZEAMMB73_Zm00001d015805 [Zea mays]
MPNMTAYDDNQFAAEKDVKQLSTHFSLSYLDYCVAESVIFFILAVASCGGAWDQHQLAEEEDVDPLPEAVITEINENIGTTGVVSQECKAIVSQCGQQILDLLLAEYSSKRQPFRSYDIKIFSGPKPMKLMAHAHLDSYAQACYWDIASWCRVSHMTIALCFLGSSSEIELRRVDYFSSKELPQVLERKSLEKWSFVKSEQKRSEIQGLMELVLQRSSCLDLLDDILLGYKAEWPMNIGITVDALKIHAKIL